MRPKDAEGITNNVDTGLICLPRPTCISPKNFGLRIISVHVLVCPPSVCLWFYVRFVYDSLVAICWETAVLHVWCFYTWRRPTCFSFPFGVLGMMWNSIVSLPDYCLFITTLPSYITLVSCWEFLFKYYLLKSNGFSKVSSKEKINPHATKRDVCPSAVHDAKLCVRLLLYRPTVLLIVHFLYKS